MGKWEKIQYLLDILLVSRRNAFPLRVLYYKYIKEILLYLANFNEFLKLLAI